VGYSLLADIRARTDESKLANVRFAPIADVLRHCGEPTLRAIETDITRVIKTARVEPARRSQPRCPLKRQEGARRLISRSLLCFMSRTPREYTKASSGLCKSCPQIGDIPKSPFSPGGSAGAVGRRINTPSRVAFRSAAVSTRLRRCARSILWGRIEASLC
jgi:hypothetical protein